MTGRNRRIVLYGNPVLRIRARRVERIDDQLRQLFEDLKTTMLTQDGAGLAANQIGEPIAVIALNPHDENGSRPFCIINPEIAAEDGTIEAEEGCLSFPGLFDIVRRPSRVTVTGLDETGKPLRLDAKGLMARAICHEIDHINGVLFIDHIGPARRRMMQSRLTEIEQQELRQCE